ncbi:trichothecene 3-o-acetyltransferase [Trichoderma arundinaceum]|uniref:Trichothecene 3-o-acetyltransferase n=1 Tax=Trichoderma arundinaceum TaxID=490622 RepID=A0A395NYL3_TRIAR|nr:trichothecene 3-o-acetyltransferase [Trichoderma arundinaceum]
MEDFSKYQDVPGQLMFLKTYTHIVLGFPIADGVSDDAVAGDIQAAAGKLTDAFPWLTGHVVREGAGPGNSGVAKIAPYPPGARPTSVVVVKDRRSLCPSLQSIVDAGAPMSMLDGELLSSRDAMPISYDESIEPAPVISIQANFIEGGVLIAFAAQHNILDMNGMAQAIRLFAKAYRGEQFTQYEIEQGNRDRRNIVRLLGPDEPKTDLTRFTVPPGGAEHPEPPSDVKWAYFNFSGQKLAELKKTASTSGSWISTDDALSALVCQRITSARLQRLGAGPPGTTVGFCRAINGRRYLETPLPREYMGHMVYCTERVLPVNDAAVTVDLPALAANFREDINNLRPAAIHTFVTAVAESEDKGAITYGALLDYSKYDIIYSSWTGLGLYQETFGALGKPLIAKREKFKPMESLIYLMPKTNTGDIDVALCLREEDIGRLKADETFMKYAKYIG